MTIERLQKYLARSGVASRRHSEQLISAGRVKVNGKIVTELGTKVEAGRDLVTVDSRLVELESERHWFMLYKPPGVVTTMSDPQGRTTVGDLAQNLGARVFPVGRLDFDAEGALLLTSDGEVANRLLHPSQQVPRTYLVKVKGVPTGASLDRLLMGVRLEDGPARAERVSVFEKAEKNTWLTLVVTEGRQHLVKRLCAAVGHPVVRLYRPSQAGLSVAGLRPGQLRPLTAEEVAKVTAVSNGERVTDPPLKLPARRHGHGFGRDEPGEDDQPSAFKAQRRVEAEAPVDNRPRRLGAGRETKDVKRTRPGAGSRTGARKPSGGRPGAKPRSGAGGKGPRGPRR